MARKLNLVTPDIGAPTTDNPDGTYLDEAAGVPGTPILGAEKNSIYYFFSRMMREAGKAFNGSPDTINSSQFFDSLAEFVSGRDSAVSEWAAGTFNANDVVIHNGLQWFVGQASTINTPGVNSQWSISKTFREYMHEAVNAGPMLGGFLPIDNIRDTTNYRQYYRKGKFEWNGAKLEAWALHIDGTSHTSGTSDVAKLLAQSKFSSQVIASESGGMLTLKSYKGLSDRSVDDTGGDTEDVGDRQEDAMQRITGLSITNAANGNAPYQGAFSGGATDTQQSALQSGEGYRINFDSSLSTSPNPAKTDDDETHVKNVAKGVWELTIIVPEGTI